MNAGSRLMRRRVLLSLALILLLLPVLVQPARAGRPIGMPFPIFVEPESERDAAIAYNSQREEYLVVFWNDRPGCDDIRAERVSSLGQPLGGKWVSAGCPADRSYPDVAYNNKRNEYMVVWRERNITDQIKAVILSATGNPLVGPITLQTKNNYMNTPAVAHSYTSDTYLVVWEEWPGGTTEGIVGRAVSGAGQPKPGFINVSNGYAGQPREPDIAYNRHANGFLVVWQHYDQMKNVMDIYGRLINGDGGTPFPPYLIDLWNEDCTDPAVAALPTSNTKYKFLVVYEKLSNPGDRDIMGRMIEENGNPSQSGAFYLHPSAVDQRFPDVAGDEAGKRYLVVWREPLTPDDIPIQARAVSAEGQLLYTESGFPGPDCNQPAVAAGRSGTFLVAWQQGPPGGTKTDLLGQLWGKRVYLPVVLR